MKPASQQQQSGESKKEKTKGKAGKEKENEFEPIFEVTSKTKDFCPPTYLGLCVIALINGADYNENKQAELDILTKVRSCFSYVIFFTVSCVITDVCVCGVCLCVSVWYRCKTCHPTRGVSSSSCGSTSSVIHHLGKPSIFVQKRMKSC
jgi:hypothetical protein